jgi:hypothetical protein
MWINFFFSCARELQQETYDIVHLHCPVFTTADVITAHSVHKVGVDLLLNNERNILQKILLWIKIGYPFIMPVAAYNYRHNRCKKVIAISSGIKKELYETLRVPHGDIVVIPNGVNRCEFNPQNRRFFRNNIRQHYGIEENRSGCDIRRK